MGAFRDSGSGVVAENFYVMSGDSAGGRRNPPQRFRRIDGFGYRWYRGESYAPRDATFGFAGLMNRDELDTLFRRHNALVVRVAHRIAGNRDVAEDIAQNVWLHLLEAGAGPRDMAAVESWLKRVALNMAIDGARRESRLNEMGALFQAECEVLAVADSDAEPSEFHEVLEDAIRRLPRRQREVVEMRLLAGSTVKVTSEALQVAEGTVKATLSQAKRALRKVVG